MDKLQIKEFSDWSTDTSDNMINAFRETMLNNIDIADEPYVGIFWYDVNKEELFGIVSAIASELKPVKSQLFDKEVKTCGTLHYQVWKKEHNKGKDFRFRDSNYTVYPRGRVFEVGSDKYVVCVGEWIKNHPEAKEIIMDEFQLPKDKTEFKIDIHWDLGHGWSDKFL